MIETPALPSRDGERIWTGEPPDAYARPDLYDGVVFRRVLAYCVDALIVAVLIVVLWLILAVAGLLTFGLLWWLMPVLALVPIAYDTVLIGGQFSATLGMRLLGIEVRNRKGGRPDWIQALIFSLLFHATMAIFWGAPLLICFFNSRRRTAHDFLSNTIVVRRSAALATATSA